MKSHELGNVVNHPDGKHQYQIVNLLGKGGVGHTYRALDLNSSRQVAIKVVSLRQTQDWKVLELFEREAKVLSCLDHQFIPAYLDYFELETADDKKFYLVQELVEGKSLANLVADGWHGTELEISEIAIQLLDILSYLHSFDPPVIHRDLKPHNIIRRSDGKVYLVDFGAVQDIYRHTVSLSKTFVGTLGYMPLEQLRGSVSPASDLYSLGCTLLFLLTHKSPCDLPQKGLSIDFSNRVNVSAHFQTWLTQILEPIAEDRFQSAAVAQQALNKPKISSIRKPFDRHAFSKDRFSIAKSSSNLRIKLSVGVHHPQGLLEPNATKVVLACLGLAILPELTIGFLLLWFLSLFSAADKPQKPKIVPIAPVERYISLNINSQTIALEKSVRLDYSGDLKIKRQEANTADFVWVNTVGGEGTPDRVTIAILSDIDTEPRQYNFGQGHISEEEARWIAQEISEFIDRIRN